MGNMASMNKTISLPEEMAQVIDVARGDVTFTVWVRRAIEQRLARDFPDGLPDGLGIEAELTPATPTPRRKRAAVK
jgi:hypothetical protein